MNEEKRETIIKKFGRILPGEESAPDLSLIFRRPPSRFKPALDALKIVRDLDITKDYHMSFEREGSFINMHIVEQEGGNLPGYKTPAHHEPEVKNDVDNTLEQGEMDFGEWVAKLINHRMNNAEILTYLEPDTREEDLVALVRTLMTRGDSGRKRIQR